MRANLAAWGATTLGGAPNWRFEYDPNGNLARSIDPAGTGTVSYVYDVENRLVAASGAAGATLVYDPLGRLFQITNAAGAKTQFLHDGDKLVAEYDGSGIVTKRYIHGPGTDDPVAVYDGPALGLANRRYMMPDERGSIAALINADGSPSTINRYDAWGVPGSGNGGRFQYTGQAWIGELGLYYYKARFYSPGLGRFMQVDPIGYEDQINLYAYVGNDPMNQRDPTGQRSCPDPKDECPDIPPPPRAVAEKLGREIPRPTKGEETGGQALKARKSGEIIYRTGAKAGRGTPENFSHNPAPKGFSTILRGHAHLRTNYEGRSVAGAAEQRSNNAPGTDDQEAMHKGNVPVLTKGPDVTSVIYRIDRQDYLKVISGDRENLPDLSGQHIIIVDDER